MAVNTASGFAPAENGRKTGTVPVFFARFLCKHHLQPGQQCSVRVSQCPFPVAPLSFRTIHRCHIFPLLRYSITGKARGAPAVSHNCLLPDFLDSQKKILSSNKPGRERGAGMMVDVNFPAISTEATGVRRPCVVACLCVICSIAPLTS